MHKKNISHRFKMQIFMVFIVLFSSCSQDTRTNYFLKNYYSSKEFQKVEPISIFMDSSKMTITYQYMKNNCEKSQKKTFRFINGNFYEQYVIKDLNTDTPVDTNYVLSFNKGDTVVSYLFDDSKYSSPVGFYGMYAWKYTITKLNQSKFLLSKEHLTDKAFREEFYYDNEYHISEIKIYHGKDTLMFK